MFLKSSLEVYKREKKQGLEPKNRLHISVLAQGSFGLGVRGILLPEAKARWCLSAPFDLQKTSRLATGSSFITGNGAEFATVSEAKGWP